MIEERGRRGPAYEAVRKQYREHWGQPSRRMEYQVDGMQIAVYKWPAESNPQGVVVYATVGASLRAVPGHDADHRVEFFVGVLPEQDDVAGPLADLILHAEREGVTVEHGKAVPTNGPLWAGSQMQSFLLVRPDPVVVPTIDLDDGMRIEFLQAVPLAPGAAS